MSIGAARGNAKRVRDFGNGQPDEIAQLINHFGGGRVLGGLGVQRFADNEDFLRGRSEFEAGFVQSVERLVRTALQTAIEQKGVMHAGRFASHQSSHAMTGK